MRRTDDSGPNENSRFFPRDFQTGKTRKRLLENNNYDGLFQEDGQSDKILDYFRALENQKLYRENYLEFLQTTHIPRIDHQNHYFHTIE